MCVVGIMMLHVVCWVIVVCQIICIQVYNVYFCTCNLRTSVISPCDVLQARFDYRQLQYIISLARQTFEGGGNIW